MLKNNVKNITNAPIGIFDSGLGGLSICKEIITLLPNESIIYIADSTNAPYGEKTKEEIIQLSVKNTELLIALGCKTIVVACNTATTNAISTLRKQFKVPFIGIEPATKSAALQTKTGKIGVLATEGTLKSDLFISTSKQYRDSLEISEVKGEHLVRLIETGNIEETKPLLEKYLQPLVDNGVDNIVLGCTHYPFLIPLIKEIIPNTIKIVDAGKAVAKQTQVVLDLGGLLSNPIHKPVKLFYTNKSLIILENFLKKNQIETDTVAYRSF